MDTPGQQGSPRGSLGNLRSFDEVIGGLVTFDNLDAESLLPKIIDDLEHVERDAHECRIACLPEHSIIHAGLYHGITRDHELRIAGRKRVSGICPARSGQVMGRVYRNRCSQAMSPALLGSAQSVDAAARCAESRGRLRQRCSSCVCRYRG